MKKLIVGAIGALFLLSGTAKAGTIGIDGPSTMILGQTANFTITYKVDLIGGTNYDVANYYILMSSEFGTINEIPTGYSGSFAFTYTPITTGLKSLNADMQAIFTYFSTNFMDDQSAQAWKQVDVAAAPVPAALPLLATALGALGFMGWRRRAATASPPS